MKDVVICKKGEPAMKDGKLGNPLQNQTRRSPNIIMQQAKTAPPLELLTPTSMEKTQKEKMN